LRRSARGISRWAGSLRGGARSVRRGAGGLRGSARGVRRGAGGLRGSARGALSLRGSARSLRGSAWSLSRGASSGSGGLSRGAGCGGRGRVGAAPPCCSAGRIHTGGAAHEAGHRAQEAGVDVRDGLGLLVAVAVVGVGAVLGGAAGDGSRDQVPGRRGRGGLGFARTLSSEETSCFQGSDGNCFGSGRIEIRVGARECIE
jgi:hypothetical protein